ncbi:hypothetical protein [Bradyrhizobium sp. LMTR 3]|uniref:hypothetical protein n=1 Tax=Bradyrhizobium sp. LMTR 3 TaxID=189873 RepID=UPI00114694F9|nr:hypothetical protein [Bradyrhizobium sp. LMTR 3]
MRIIELDRTECDGANGFTDNLAQNHGMTLRHNLVWPLQIFMSIALNAFRSPTTNRRASSRVRHRHAPLQAGHPVLRDVSSFATIGGTAY